MQVSTQACTHTHIDIDKEEHTYTHTQASFGSQAVNDLYAGEAYLTDYINLGPVRHALPVCAHVCDKSKC